MRCRIAVLLLLAGVLAVPGAAAAQSRSCGTVAYPHGHTSVSVVKDATCKSARRVLTVLFNSSDDDPEIGFVLSADDGGSRPTDITVLVTIGDHYAWYCPVYRHRKALHGVACHQYKRGRKIRGSASVPRRVWRAELDDDPNGGGG